jgi:hypothetical protein
MLREQDAASQKGRSRGRSTSVSSPVKPYPMDRRLDILSTHVHDGTQLHQDHLTNVSDFRIQAQSALLSKPSKHFLPPEIVKPLMETKKAVNKKLKEEQDRLAQSQSDAIVRELTLKQLNSGLKSYILACAHTDLVSIVLHRRSIDFIICT